MNGEPSETEALEQLRERIIACRQCPRLVKWREEVAGAKRAAFINDEYWGRPVPGFGDPHASIAVVGLAPAAHGANRTGRMFTGDRSGDWLYAALFRAGFANQPEARSLDDGLELQRVWVTSPVKCAPPDNRPTTTERDTCAPFLIEELRLLANLEVIVALGGFGHAQMARILDMSPRPKFGHGSVHVAPDGKVLLGCYHVSQQNTFTGRLTEEMLDSVFAQARDLTSR